MAFEKYFIRQQELHLNKLICISNGTIFESNHIDGDFVEAEQRAETAANMQPRNATFIHTQAEVSRKRATHEHSPIIREQLRRKARAFLAKMPAGDRFAASSRCKLLVDEVSDLSESLTQNERAIDDRFFFFSLKN